jgi:hypothetical protein
MMRKLWTVFCIHITCNARLKLLSLPESRTYHQNQMRDETGGAIFLIICVGPTPRFWVTTLHSCNLVLPSSRGGAGTFSSWLSTGVRTSAHRCRAEVYQRHVESVTRGPDVRRLDVAMRNAQFMAVSHGLQHQWEFSLSENTYMYLRVATST